jgi:hypothetical protein
MKLEKIIARKLKLIVLKKKLGNILLANLIILRNILIVGMKEK